LAHPRRAARAGYSELAISTANTVLVIDDDPLVRRIAALVLRGAGYEVLVADDGDSGLEVFAAHRAVVTLVITDLTMPRMHGSEVYASLRAEHPRLPIVLSSGFSVDKQPLADLALDECASFLAKPYKADQLVDAVRKALATASV